MQTRCKHARKSDSPVESDLYIIHLQFCRVKMTPYDVACVRCRSVQSTFLPLFATPNAVRLQHDVIVYERRLGCQTVRTPLSRPSAFLYCSLSSPRIPPSPHLSAHAYVPVPTVSRTVSQSRSCPVSHTPPVLHSLASCHDAPNVDRGLVLAKHSPHTVSATLFSSHVLSAHSTLKTTLLASR